MRSSEMQKEHQELASGLARITRQIRELEDQIKDMKRGLVILIDRVDAVKSSVEDARFLPRP